MIYMEVVFIPGILTMIESPRLSKGSDSGLPGVLGFLGVNRPVSSWENEKYEEGWARKVENVMWALSPGS